MDCNAFIFSIDGVCIEQKNLRVVGRVRSGELKKGEVVHLVARFLEAKAVTCEHVFKDNQEIVRARKGDSIEIVLSGISLSDVKKGMFLSTPNYRVRFD